MVLEILIYIVAAVMSVAGLILTLVSIPGVWLIYLSTILVAMIDNFSTITPGMLIVLFLLSLLSTFVDNIVNILGVKAMGGGIWGMIGAILGGFVGLIVGNILGVILGPLVGAFFFEYFLGRKSFKESIKAGIGSFIGMLLTVVLKSVVNVSMIAYVVTRLLSN
jgi:uncharacterized protein YqgC (DUF456 family)